MRWESSALKNEDAKIVARTMDRCVRGEVAQSAHASRMEFTKGRNFVNNIVDLDSIGRIYGADPSSHLPVIALFDFAAAFPSIMHKYLWKSLKEIGLPKQIIKILKLLYKNIVHGNTMPVDGSRH